MSKRELPSSEAQTLIENYRPVGLRAVLAAHSIKKPDPDPQREPDIPAEFRSSGGDFWTDAIDD